MSWHIWGNCLYYVLALCSLAGKHEVYKSGSQNTFEQRLSYLSWLYFNIIQCNPQCEGSEKLLRFPFWEITYAFVLKAKNISFFFKFKIVKGHSTICWWWHSFIRYCNPVRQLWTRTNERMWECRLIPLISMNCMKQGLRLASLPQSTAELELFRPALSCHQDCLRCRLFIKLAERSGPNTWE